MEDLSLQGGEGFKDKRAVARRWRKSQIRVGLRVGKGLRDALKAGRFNAPRARSYRRYEGIVASQAVAGKLIADDARASKMCGHHGSRGVTAGEFVAPTRRRLHTLGC